MISPRTSSFGSKPRTASSKLAIQSSIEFDDFNLSAWANAYGPRFRLGQLLHARGCAVVQNNRQPSRDGVFVCPFADPACAGCTCTDGDGYDKDLSLVCNSTDCNAQSLAAKLRGYLQSGRITLVDLQDPRYLGGPLLPRGFICEPFRSSSAIFATGHYFNPKIRNRVELADDLRRINSIVVEKFEADKPIEGLMEVCDYVRVAARTCDENGRNWGYRLEYFSRDGSLTRVDVSEDLVNARGNQLFSMLAKVGLRVAPTGQAAFRTLLTSWKTKQKIVVFSRPGWHADNTIFACPTGKIMFADETRMDKHRFDLHPSARTDASQAVDHTSDWVQHVVEPIWKGDTDQFALGFLTGCSGVLSSLVGESFGFHFSGRTTIGKSTAQIIGAGCVADPAPGKGVLFTADMTASELDAARVTATATCLHIEDSKTGGLNVEKLAYVGASGEWDLPFTISSEQPLSDIVGECSPSGPSGQIEVIV